MSNIIQTIADAARFRLGHCARGALTFPRREVTAHNLYLVLYAEGWTDTLGSIATLDTPQAFRDVIAALTDDLAMRDAAMAEIAAARVAS